MRFSLCLLAITAPAAFAAPVAAQEIQDWQGVYFGAAAGIAQGSLDSSDVAMATTGPLVGLNPGQLGATPMIFESPNSTDTIAGFTGGVQAGYNWQVDNLVLGLEGGLQLGRVSLDSHLVATEQGPTYDTDAGIDGYLTLAARAGVASGNALLYGTAGLATGWGSADLTITPGLPSNPDPAVASSASNTHLGYLLGAGVEVALDENWSLRGEYQYLDLGTQTYDFAFDTEDDSSVTSTSTIQLHTVKLGLNYRF